MVSLSSRLPERTTAIMAKDAHFRPVRSNNVPRKSSFAMEHYFHQDQIDFYQIAHC